MAWSIVGTPTTSSAVASGNVTGTEPAGVASGDVMLATINFRDTPTFTLPSGWALVGSQLTGNTAASNGIAGIAQYICYRSGSAPTLVWNRTAGDMGQVRISAFRSSLGAITATQLHQSTVAQTSGQVAGTVASTITGVTLSIAGCLLYVGFSGADNGTVSSVNTANFSGLFSSPVVSTGTNTGGDGAIHMGYASTSVTTGATGNVQGTNSVAGQNALALVALNEPTPASLPPMFNRPLRVWQKRF